MSQRSRSTESGFALILALLSLVLLTTMGLALSSSTSVELQISSNHRWSESARYNAEAGIEYGKSILVPMGDWTPILPPARVAAGAPVPWAPGAWDPEAQAANAGGVPPVVSPRNFENWQCDVRGFGMGYGVVFNDPVNGPQEYRSQLGTPPNEWATLNGAFTLWVRRPVAWTDADADGLLGDGPNYQDYPGNDALILVAEGVAPYTGGQNATAFAATNRAVYTIETLLSRAGGTIPCDGRGGQTGGSASGGNSSGCVALDDPDDIIRSLRNRSTDLGGGGLLP